MKIINPCEHMNIDRYLVLLLRSVPEYDSYRRKRWSDFRLGFTLAVYTTICHNLSVSKER